MIQVVIADDQEMLHETFEMYSADGDYTIVGHCYNGKEALETVLSQTPDIIVLDIELPILNGLEVASKIRQAKLPTKILIATQHKDALYLEQTIRAKLHGFMHKDESPKRYGFILFTLMAGNYYLSPAVTETVFDLFNDQKQDPARPDHDLTPREQEILRMIANQSTTRQIADAFHLSVHTVNNHRRAINRKLQISNPHELIQKARDLGLTP